MINQITIKDFKLFKAKSLETNNWCYGYLASPINIIGEFNTKFIVSPATICQFVVKLGRYGLDIYEYDVLAQYRISGAVDTLGIVRFDPETISFALYDRDDDGWKKSPIKLADLLNKPIDGCIGIQYNIHD